MAKDEVDDLLYRIKFKNPKERVEIINTLGNLGDIRATQPILQQLSSKNSDLLIASIFALGKLKDVRAVSSLVDLLTHKKEKIGKYAAQSLGKIGDLSAVESMCSSLLKVKPPLAHYILESLGMIGDKEAVPSILFFIEKKKPKEELLATAIKALSSIKDPTAVSAILPYLDHSNRNTRAFSAEALGVSKDPTTIKILLDHLSDPDDYVIEKILKSLEELNPTFKGKNREKIVSQIYLGLIKSNKAIPYQDPTDLVQILKKETDPESRAYIIYLMGEKQVTKAIKTLVKIQKTEKNLYIRRAIQEALSKMNYLPKNLEGYISQFQSDDIQKRIAAANALAMISDDRVFEILFSSIKEHYQDTNDNMLALNVTILNALSKYDVEKSIGFYKQIYKTCPIELYDVINNIFEQSNHPAAKTLLGLPYRSDGRWGKPLSLSDMGFKRAAKKEEKHQKIQERVAKQKALASEKKQKDLAKQAAKNQLAVEKAEQEKLRLETKRGLKKQKEQKKREELKAKEIEKHRKELEKHRKELEKHEKKRNKENEKSNSCPPEGKKS